MNLLRYIILVILMFCTLQMNFGQYRNFIPYGIQTSSTTKPQVAENKDLVESFKVNYSVSDEQFHSLLLHQSILWQILPTSIMNDPGNQDSSVVSATVIVDSLLDYMSGISVDRSILTALKIDSISFTIGHQSTSGGINSFELKIIELNAQNYPLGNVWVTQEINTGQGLSPSNNWRNLTSLTFKPEFYLPPPFRFAAQITYQGALQDTFGLVAGFSSDGACVGNIPKAMKSGFYPNSLAYIKKFNSLIPTSAGSDIYYDCNNNQQYDTLTDGNNLIQNWDVTFYFTKHTLSIPLTGIEAQMHISPNPASDFIWIQIPEKNHGIALCQIKTISGKTIFTTQLNSNHSFGMSIPASIPAGFYVVEIMTENKIYNQKLIVAR